MVEVPTEDPIGIDDVPPINAETTRGAKFLKHIINKFGPGEEATAFKKNRFLYDVARIQDEAAADNPQRSR